MIEIWGLDGALAAEAAEARAVDAGKALLNGPAQPGQGLDQSDVDMVMGPAVWLREGETPIELVEEAVVEFPVEEPVLEVPANAEPVALAEVHTGEDKIEEAEPVVVQAPQPKPRAASVSDPLAPFMALSAEEKIALFT